MGFDFGIALGAGAKAGVDTYSKLQEEERLANAEKRSAEQFNAWKKEQAGKEALQGAASYVANMGDTQNVPDQAAMANPQGNYQTYEGEDGPVTPTQAVPISAKEKEALFVKKALAGGADPTAVLAHQKGILEYGKLSREEEFASKKQKLMVDSATQQEKLSELVKNNDTAGIITTFGKQYEGATGHKVSLTSNGTVEITDKSGKKLESFSDIGKLGEALDGLIHKDFQDKYSKLDPDYGLKKAGVDIQGRAVKVQESELAQKIRVNLFGAQANQANAAADASRSHAMVYRNMVELSKSSKEANAAMKPFIDEYSLLSAEEQAGAKGQAILLKAASAAATKTNDITGIINALKKPDKNSLNAEWQTQNAAYIKAGWPKVDVDKAKEEFFQENGVATPSRIEDGQTQIKKLIAAGKKTEAEAFANNFNEKFSNYKLKIPESAPEKTNTKKALPIKEDAPYTVPGVEVIPARTGTKYKVQGLGTFNSMEEAQAAKQANKDQRIKVAPGAFTSALNLGG